VAEVVMRKVTKSFKGVEVIHGVDLDIRHREFVVFVGPSGCGKSTLLRLVAGLEDVTSGDLFIDRTRVNDAPPAERGIAMVFQSYALYPHMTVFENMAFGLKLAKAGKHEIARRVREAARILQIEDLLERRPRELSGGQRQRVAIGRAITREPKVFLFDEPLSNVDAALRVQMRLEIARLKDEVAATMIYVTHDQVEAMTLADRIVVLNAGRVEQVGEPLELYRRPRNLFVAGFIGSPRMNFLPGAAEAVRPGEIAIRLRGGALVTVPAAHAAPIQQGSEVTLGVRPEHVFTAAPPGGMDGSSARIRGEVLVVEKLGAESFIYARTDAGDTLVARSDPAERAAPGEQVELHLHARRCHLFGPDGVAVALSSPVDD
jgi:multiple sugar transport system ATP-binding protein